MFGNINDIRKKTEDNNESEACYGGFSRRFSYEKLCRDDKKNPVKRVFAKLALTVCACMFFGVFAILCAVSVFRLVQENSSLYYPNNTKLETAQTESALRPINEAVQPTESKFVLLQNSVTAENVSHEVSQRYRIPTGVIVHDVCEDSAAHTAGLLDGDIIVAINDASAAEIENIDSFLSSQGEDTDVKLTVFRDDTYIELNININ